MMPSQIGEHLSLHEGVGDSYYVESRSETPGQVGVSYKEEGGDINMSSLLMKDNSDQSSEPHTSDMPVLLKENLNFDINNIERGLDSVKDYLSGHVMVDTSLDSVKDYL